MSTATHSAPLKRGIAEPLLDVKGLTKHFPITSGVFGRVVGQVRAVDDVSFQIGRGETLGLVGESGCGKTTVGRSILRLIEPSSGRVTFDGKDVLSRNAGELRELRRDMQVIFQDPFSSLNPRMRVLDIVGEALEVHGVATGRDAEKRVAELLRKVGLSPAWINRYPHEFSGGQRQRIGVARAIALEPKLIVCDEAVSALDVSIQAQVINLLIQLRREMELSYLFIAHDLSVVRHISHRIAVMYLGHIVEHAPSKRLFAAPAHPYTRALLSAIPVPNPHRRVRRLVLHGDVPSPANPPSGCRFHTRCPAVMDICREEVPRLVNIEENHSVKCVHSYDIEPGADWYRIVSERIEAATAKNRAVSSSVTPPAPPPPVAEAEPADEIEEEVLPRAREQNENGRRQGQRVPVGLVIIGASAGLVVGGLVWTGLSLAIVAYFAAVRPAFAPQRRADIAFIAALVASFLLWQLVVMKRDLREQATAEIAGLEAELEARARASGTSPPEKLSDLGWRLYSIFDDGKPIDPWGRPYGYRAPGTKGRPYDLGSVGPDGVPSSDDIGHVPK